MEIVATEEPVQHALQQGSSDQDARREASLPAHQEAWQPRQVRRLRHQTAWSESSASGGVGWAGPCWVGLDWAGLGWVGGPCG